MNWQPEETAPLFTLVLVYTKPNTFTAIKNDEGNWFNVWDIEILGITHWMPLPEPPK